MREGPTVISKLFFIAALKTKLNMIPVTFKLILIAKMNNKLLYGTYERHVSVGSSFILVYSFFPNYFN
jgi:hypothetical protein